MTSQIDLHGAEVLYLPDQTAPITVGPSSIVGLVGAAFDAQGATNARLSIGAANAALTVTAVELAPAVAASVSIGAGASELIFTAKEAGPSGNNISIEFILGSELKVEAGPDKRSITVTLEEDGGGAAVTTLKALIDHWAGSDGGGVVTANGGDNAVDGTKLAATPRMRLLGGLGARASGGAAGNAITVEIVRPVEADNALAITVDGNAIVVRLDTDDKGVPTTTANQLVTAWAAATNPHARRLVSIAANGAGTGVLAPLARTPLAGGMDEPFPLNTPVAISSPAAAARLGTTGSLPEAIADVWRTAGSAGATIVVVRTADDEAASVIGDRTAGTGIYALLSAEAAETAGFKPRLIAAPALQTIAAALALEAVADALRATPVVTLSGASYSDAVAARQPLAHTYAVWPEFRVFDAEAGKVVDRSASALAIGHIVRVDAEESFAASPSNRRLQDVAGTAVAVDWQIDDRNATANLLSRAFIATAIRRRGGLHLWGNRLADGELITHRRVRHLIGDALLAFIADYMDRNVDVPFVEHVLDRMNAYLRSQTLARIVTGGRAWFDAAYNTPDTLAANKVTFSFDLGLHAVAEQLTFRQSVSGVYNDEIIAQLTGAEA